MNKLWGSGGRVLHNIGTIHNPVWRDLVTGEIVDCHDNNNVFPIWQIGFAFGVTGMERDMNIKDCVWHRGYTRGRLQRYKKTGKMYL
jgi:hypothetical protein